MAENSSTIIKKITVKNESGTVLGTYDVCLPEDIAKHFELTGDGTAKNFSISSDHHINIEPEAWATGKSTSAKLGDIQFKPGDDIAFYSHHRNPNKLDEVNMSVMDGSDNPVKLQVQLANLTLSTKGKDLTKTVHSTDGTMTSSSLEATGSSAEEEILDLNISTGKTSGNKKGYLKVRARAIDLRCEEHGGIALQPKGRDSSQHENKIKFEHGGGDGLEFGTFNTEKTSIFTNEYRFNKDGVWKMATRQKENQTGSKKVLSDPTTHYIYKKNTITSESADAAKYELGDDFYDFIEKSDYQCRTKDIIKTAYSLNGARGIHTKTTGSGNLEIKSFVTYHWSLVNASPSDEDKAGLATLDNSGANPSQCVDILPGTTGEIAGWYSGSDFDSKSNIYTPDTNYVIGGKIYKWVMKVAPQIQIQSDADLEMSAEDDIKLTTSDAVKVEATEIKLNAPTDGINFGQTKSIVFTTSKLTKKANVEAIPDDIKIGTGVENNTSSNVYFCSDGKFKFPILSGIWCKTKSGNGTSGSAATAAATEWSSISTFTPNLTTGYYKAGSSKCNNLVAVFSDAECTTPLEAGTYFILSDYVEEEQHHYGYYRVEVDTTSSSSPYPGINCVKEDGVAYVVSTTNAEGTEGYTRLAKKVYTYAEYIALPGNSGVSSEDFAALTNEQKAKELYYPDTTFVSSTYTAISGETTIEPGETYQTSSFTLQELTKLMTWAKSQEWWASL